MTTNVIQFPKRPHGPSKSSAQSVTPLERSLALPESLRALDVEWIFKVADQRQKLGPRRY